MRKLLTLILMLALCLTTVSALQVSTPVLTGDRNNDVTTKVTITNDGTETISDIEFSTTADSKYNITFETIPDPLIPGATAKVTIKGFIPEDFNTGKHKIGKITVTSNSAENTTSDNSSNTSGNPFGSHTFTPDNQTPQLVTIPVGMSASNDCGQNTPDPGMPIIGQWHTGKCDWIPDIEVSQPFEGEADAGWARIHSDNINDYWINTVGVDCNGQSQTPPQNWLHGGKIHSGPGLCDGNIELPGGDSGWTGFYTKPSAEGKLILVIADDRCGGGIQQVPADGIILGRVKTGPGKCDGQPEAFAYNGNSLDAGAMYVVYQPIDHTPSNFLPIGDFDSLSWTSLSGWAYDEDAPTIKVHVFVDSEFWKELTADEARPDLVADGLTPDADHGFSYDFTQSDLDSLNTSMNHTFHIYAINSPQDENPLLNGSPRLLENMTSYVEGSQDNSSDDNSSDDSSNSDDSSGNPDASNTVTVDLFMETQNRLVIDRVKLNCDDLETVNEGDTIDDVSPDQTCFLTVRVENTFGDDTEIRDIEVEADPENSDISGDSDDISSLDARDREEITLELDIDNRAEGKIDIEITAEGKDEHGAEHSDSFQFAIDIERLKHDLQVTRLTVSPREADLCTDRRVDVAVYIENDGNEDEERVGFKLSVPGLNFDETIDDIPIDRNEEERVTFSVPLSRSAPFGSFRATASALFENVVEMDSRSTDIVVMKCSTTSSTVSNSGSTSATVSQNSNTDPGVIVVGSDGTATTQASFSGPQVVSPPPVVPDDELIVIPPKGQNQTSGFLGSALFTGILVMANLIALTVLGVMGYSFYKRKNESEEEFEAQFDDTNSIEAEVKDYY